MSEAKECVIDSKCVDEDEPEEGEIQDDDEDGSLEDVSSEEDISAKPSDSDSFNRSKYIPSVFMPSSEYLPRVSPCHNKNISKLFNRKTRECSRSGCGDKRRVNLIKYGEKKKMLKSELHHVKLTLIADEKERDNLNLLSDYKPIRPMQTVKDDTVQEKENRHDCRNEVREKRICRRKHRQSVLHNPEKNTPSSSKPENVTSSKKPYLPQEDRKRKLLLKYNKISHSKKRNLSPRREKHKHAKKKNNKKELFKKVSNAVKNSSFESITQENSLLKRLQTMMSLKNIPKTDATQTVNEDNLHSESNVANEMCYIRQNDNFVTENENSNNPQEILLKDVDDDVGCIEILPEVKKPDPVVITLEDSDSEPQIVDEVEEKSEIVTNSEKERLDPREMSEKDDEDEDLLKLRLLALQSKSRQKEVPKPKIDDEEVMQLRLAALKSAVIKKFQLRKQRGVKTKLDASDSASPLSLTHSDNPDESEEVSKSLGQSNTVGEPDEITTLVDMDVCHTDDEREIETSDQNEPVLESIPLPNTMTVSSVHSEHNMQNNMYFGERMGHTDVSVDWSTSVATYENSDISKFSSNNYLMPDVYNNNNVDQQSAYVDPQLPHSSTFPQQHGYHDSYINNSNSNLPFSSSVHNIIPAPNLTSLTTSPSRVQSHFLGNESQVHPSTSSNVFSIPSIIQNSRSNYDINHQNTPSISLVSRTNEQSFTEASDFQAVEKNVDYLNNHHIPEEQQNIHFPVSSEFIGSNSKYGVEMSVEGFESSESQLGNVQSEEIIHTPENVHLSRMIVLDEIGHCSSPEAKSEILGADTLSNETLSHPPQQENTNNLDDDEEVLRARLLINLAKKSARITDSTRSEDVESIKQLHPSNVISSVNMSKKVNSTNSSRPITNVVKAPSAAIGGLNLHLKSKQMVSSKLPASALRLTKVNKFPQKFVSKNTQHFDKSHLPNSGKFWKKTVRTNRKQVLTKINKKGSGVELIKSGVQNVKQVVQCQKIVTTTFGTSKPTSLQVTVPTKNMGDDKCKRKVAESDLNSGVPNQPTQRFVIHLGEDSDSGDEDEDLRPIFQSKRRCVVAPSTNNITVTNDSQKPIKSDLSKQNIESTSKKQTVLPTDAKVSDEFEKSVDVFLKQARLSQEAKAGTVLTKANTPYKGIADKIGSFSSSTPQAVRHLPSSQQEEYRRLKQQIAKHEEKKKQRQLNVLNKVPSPAVSPAKSGSSIGSLKITVTTNNSTKDINKISMNLERKIETSVLNTLPQSTKSVDSDIVRFEEEENSKHTNLLPENKSENFQEINNSEQSSKTVNLQTNRNLETSEKNTNVVVPKTDETDNINLTSNSEDLQEVPSENMQQGIDTPENTITNNEEKLQHAENQLLSKRKEVIENLTHMNSLLQQIEVEIALEEECVLELHQMNLAVLRLEEKIAQQRKLLSDMRSTMSEAHKQVIKGRSECIHLSKTCLSLGIGLKGKQYKVPVGEADLMNNKLQQVAAQTKRLSKKKDQEETPPENVISMLSQPQTPVQNTTITGCECDKPKLSPDVFSDTIDCSSSTKSNSLNNKLIVTTSDNSTVHSDSTKSDNSTDQSNLIISNSSCELAKDKCEKKCEETPKSVDSESSKQIDPVVVPCLNTSTSSEDFVPVASAEASEFHLESVKRISTGELEESPDYDDVAIGLNDELQVALPQQLVEYVSPLESLNCKRNRTMVGDVEDVLDPIVIFCPYELMGTCHDEECKYQHQTKHNST